MPRATNKIDQFNNLPQSQLLKKSNLKIGKTKDAFIGLNSESIIRYFHVVDWATNI